MNIHNQITACPHSCDAMTATANMQISTQTITMQCETRKVHKDIPQKEKEAASEQLLFLFLWKNSALNVAPSIFNIHAQPSAAYIKNSNANHHMYNVKSARSTQFFHNGEKNLNFKNISFSVVEELRARHGALNF